MYPLRTGFVPVDDGELYYRVAGEGPPVVCCNGVGVSTFFWKYLDAHLRSRFQVLQWDYIGHGRSTLPPDPANADLSMERMARDLFAVMDHAGLTEPALLVGHSMGCQVILEAARQQPDRVAGLVPMFGTFAKPMDTFMDSPLSRPIFERVVAMGQLVGTLPNRLLRPLTASAISYAFSRQTGLVDRYYASKEDMQPYMDHLVRMDLRIFLFTVEHMNRHDLTDFLPEIDVPVLVVAGENDLFTPMHRSYTMVERIPDAELIVIAEGSHAALIEHPETINLRLDRFLAERLPQWSAPQR